jgi:hypothetical protein
MSKQDMYILNLENAELFHLDEYEGDLYYGSVRGYE